MTKLVKLTGEIRNLFGLLEWPQFLRWLGLLLALSPKVLRSGSLGVVDEAFGERIRFRTGGRFFSIEHGALGVVREIIGSQCYVRAEDLCGCRNILDLGSNCGVFTLFCLANAPEANVVGVEVQAALVDVARQNIEKAGFSKRAFFQNAYAGEEDDFIKNLAAGSGETVRFSPEAYIARVGKCDFMKCDIEGAEYSLITSTSTWLHHVRKISLEYHGTWEQGFELGNVLRGHGFTVSQHLHGNLGYLSCVSSRL